MNKQKRREAVYKRIKEAVGPTRAKYNLQKFQNASEDYREINDHAGVEAVRFAGEILSEFKFPNHPNLSYGGMHRKSGSGAHDIHDGTIIVNAEIKSLTGIKNRFEIPIMVEGSRMLPPSVIFHNGNVEIIAQSTFDDMIDGTTSLKDMDFVKSMFSAPPDNRHDYPPYNKDWPKQKIVQDNMFSVFASKRDAIKSAMTGVVTGLKENKKEALVSQDNYLDEAERDRSNYLVAGEEITLGGEVLVRNRGGGIHRLAAGTRGRIIRDIDNTGRLFYVSFPTMCAVVNIHQIEGELHPRDRDYSYYEQYNKRS